MSRKVEGAIDKEDLSIRSSSSSPSGKAVYFKDVPLWISYSTNIDQLEIYLAEYDEGTPYELVCKDENGEYSYYGGWQSLGEAKAWLQSPRPLR